MPSPLRPPTPTPTEDAVQVLAQGLLALPTAIQILACDGTVVFESEVYRSQFGASATPEARALVERPNGGTPSALRDAVSGNARTVPLGEIGGRLMIARYFPLRVGGSEVTHVGVLYEPAPPASDERSPRVAFPAPSLASIEDATPVEQQLRFVIDAVPQLIWSTLPDGYHDFYNRRWYEYIGASPEETRGAGWNDPLHPDDQHRAWERWQRSLRTGEDYQIEYRFRRHDGVYRWFLGRALPMRDAAGQIVRWFGTCTDIDDQKRLEDQRADVLSQAEANNRMKDDFLATLSHELRTPLTAILGWARIQESRPDLAPKAIEVIRRNAKAQARLIEEVLEVSRIVAGKVHVLTERVDFAAVVQRAIDTLRPSADAKGVALDVSIAPDLATLAGDADRLQQVVSNLLGNALKFTPEGGTITTIVGRGHSEIVLTIRDTGSGIAPSFLPHVFERFRQAEGGTTRHHGGLGLGLAIVRHLVELHGGAVAAESPGEGHGATFTVRLPLRALLIDAASGDGVPLPSELAAEGATVRLDGLQVLVVEDEPDARELISTVLRHAGAQIREAASVDEALDHVMRCLPDVIVSDIGMPSGDGYLLMRTLRAKSIVDGGDVPALALTAYARDEDRKRALDAGFQMHLLKPIEPEALVAGVHRLATGRVLSPALDARDRLEPRRNER